MILSAPGKLSLQLQGWETLGYSSFTPVLVSLSFTQRHTHTYTHISALYIFSLQHKFLCSLAFIQAHPFSGRQAVYFLCTFNSKYIHVFPTGAYTLLPFHMCKEALKQSTSTTRTPLWHFFFPFHHWQRAPYSFCSNLLAMCRESRRIKLLLSLPSLLKGHAKMGLVSPEATVKKLPTFPYS